MSQQQDAQAFAQVGVLIDQLMHWIVTTNHTRPGQIISAGTDAYTPEQAQRMADEYAIVDQLITVLDETSKELKLASAEPMSYEQQLAARFNELLSPQTALVVQRFTQAFDSSQNIDERAKTYRVHLHILTQMFDRIAILRGLYEQKLQSFR